MSVDKEELEYQQMLVDIYNNTKGNLNELDCPICKNKGYIRGLIVEDDKIYDYLNKCDCMTKRMILRTARNSGLGEYVNKKFEDYVIEYEWQRTVKLKAIEYCKNFDGKKWFTILGQSGGGKTLIACIISNYILLKANKEVKYVVWTDFISQIKRDLMTGESDNINQTSEYLEKVKNVDVLFLDELLKKYNETDLKYVIEIINYRYTKNLTTIITSENSLQKLIDIDEATAGRIVEKSQDYLFEIEKNKQYNYRIKNLL